MTINNKTHSIRLEYGDLRYDVKQKPFSEIECHDFTHLTTKMINQSSYIYYIDNHGIMKVLKTRYKLSKLKINL
jgi:hypothetical protein